MAINKKFKCCIYRDTNAANAALAEYIKSNIVVRTGPMDVYNDHDEMDFEYIGLQGPLEWYGPIDGIFVVNNLNEYVIFVSWFPEDESEKEEYLNRIMDALYITPQNGPV